MWNLPENVKTALNIIDKNGHEAYLVGGCVRDKIMEREINDYDMTTSASVGEIKEMFCEYPLVLSGEKHGTVGVVSDGEVLEITTYRTDGAYLDGRHPEEVVFVKSFYEDSARRDFTMNSIGYNPKTGYADHHGGIEDIKNGIIRCVGDPKKRFSEDALRIMRAVRFSSQLCFALDEQTSSAAVELRNNLRNISKERLFEELKKLLMGDDVEKVLNEYMIILSSFIPDLEEMIDYDQENYHHNLTLSAHTAKVVSCLPKDVTLRLAGLLHDISKPECATKDEKGIKHFRGHPTRGCEKAVKILSSLKCDNRTVEDVYLLIKYHDVDIEESPRAIKRMLSKLGERLFFMLIDLKIADNLAQDPKFYRADKFERIKIIAREIIFQEECFSLKDLKINGRDIIALGYAPSKKTGECLKYLLEMVIDEIIGNEREALLYEAEKFMRT